MTPTEIARKLTEAQREALVACNPMNVSREEYAPFKGASQGLFVIAPGWQGMELSALGLAVRAELMKEEG